MEVVTESHGVRCPSVQSKSRYTAAFVEQNFSSTDIPVFFLLPIIFMHKKPTNQQQQKNKTTTPNHKNQPQQTKPPKGAGKAYGTRTFQTAVSAMLFEPLSAQVYEYDHWLLMLSL